MTNEPYAERGQLLFEQGRYAQALTAFQQALAQDPDDVQALYWVGHTLHQLQRYPEALTVTNDLLGREPDEPYYLNLKAMCLSALGRLAEALQAAQEAVRFEPSDAELWYTLASTQFFRSDYKRALDSAEEGLRIDPDDIDCRNLRNQCLPKLGRADEVAAGVADTLTAHPNNAVVHATAGSALLEAGDHRQARTHFAEALRLDPTLQLAEAGLLEALKAKNWLYRIFLRYTFWMQRFQYPVRVVIIVGVLLLMRTIADIGLRVNQPILVALGALLFVALVALWFVEPAFNILMAFDAEGRYLLTTKQRRFYPYVAGVLVTGVVLVVLGAAQWPALWPAGWLGIGLMLLLALVPFYDWINVQSPTEQRWLRGFLLLLGLTLIATLVLHLTTELGLLGAVLFLIEVGIYYWIDNLRTLAQLPRQMRNNR